MVGVADLFFRMGPSYSLPPAGSITERGWDFHENDFFFLGDPALPHSPVPSLPSLTHSGESFLRKRMMEGSTSQPIEEVSSQAIQEEGRAGPSHQENLQNQAGGGEVLNDSWSRLEPILEEYFRRSINSQRVKEKDPGIDLNSFFNYADCAKKMTKKNFFQFD